MNNDDYATMRRADQCFGDSEVASNQGSRACFRAFALGSKAMGGLATSVVLRLATDGDTGHADDALVRAEKSQGSQV